MQKQQHVKNRLSLSSRILCSKYSDERVKVEEELSPGPLAPETQVLQLCNRFGRDVQICHRQESMVYDCLLHGTRSDRLGSISTA